MLFAHKHNEKSKLDEIPNRLVFDRAGAAPSSAPRSGLESTAGLREILDINQELKQYMLGKIDELQREMINNINDPSLKNYITGEINNKIGDLKRDFLQIQTKRLGYVNDVETFVNRQIKLVESSMNEPMVKSRFNPGSLDRILGNFKSEYGTKVQQYSTRVTTLRQQMAVATAAIEVRPPELTPRQEISQEARQAYTEMLVDPAMHNLELKSAVTRRVVPLIAHGYESEPTQDSAIEKELAVADQETYILYQIAKEFGEESYSGGVNIYDLKSYFTEHRGKHLFGFYWDASENAWRMTDDGGLDEEYPPEFIFAFPHIVDELESDSSDNMDRPDADDRCEKIALKMRQLKETYENRNRNLEDSLAIIPYINQEGVGKWADLSPSLIQASLRCGVINAGLYVYRVHNGKIYALRKKGVKETPSTPLMWEFRITNSIVENPETATSGFWRREEMKRVRDPEAVLTEIVKETSPNVLLAEEASLEKLKGDPKYAASLLIGTLSKELEFSFNKLQMLKDSLHVAILEEAMGENFNSISPEKKEVIAAAYVEHLINKAQAVQKEKYPEADGAFEFQLHVNSNGTVDIIPLNEGSYEELVIKAKQEYQEKLAAIKARINKMDANNKRVFLGRLREGIESLEGKITYRELIERLKQFEAPLNEYESKIAELKSDTTEQIQQERREAASNAPAPQATEQPQGRIDRVWNAVKNSWIGQMIGKVASWIGFEAKEIFTMAVNWLGLGEMFGLGAAAGATAAVATNQNRAETAPQQQEAQSAAPETIAAANINGMANNASFDKPRKVAANINGLEKDLRIPQGATIIAGDAPLQLTNISGGTRSIAAGESLQTDEPYLITSTTVIPKNTILPEGTKVFQTSDTTQRLIAARQASQPGGEQVAEQPTAVAAAEQSAQNPGSSQPT